MAFILRLSATPTSTTHYRAQSRTPGGDQTGLLSCCCSCTETRQCRVQVAPRKATRLRHLESWTDKWETGERKEVVELVRREGIRKSQSHSESKSRKRQRERERSMVEVKQIRRGREGGRERERERDRER